VLQVGSILQNKYRIEELLGQGSIGQVFRGRHLLLKKQVAIKVLLPEHTNRPDVVTRFKREALVGAHVIHPNIAAAVDLGHLDDGTHFLVLELVRGVTLREFLRRGALSPRRSVRVALGVARALRCLHEAGIVHRDLKPANVMLAEGSEDAVKLIDFGLAQVEGHSKLVTELEDTSMSWRTITTEGQFLGTVAYVAPEVRHGMDAIGAPSDLYALGVMLFEMLAGRRPFVAPSPAELMRKQLNDPAPPLQPLVSDALPPRLCDLVARLLAKEPGQRPSAEELVTELEDLVARLGHVSQRPHPTMAEWEARGQVILPGPDVVHPEGSEGDAHEAHLSHEEISQVLRPESSVISSTQSLVPEAPPTERDPGPPEHFDAPPEAPPGRAWRPLAWLLGVGALLLLLAGLWATSLLTASGSSSPTAASAPPVPSVSAESTRPSSLPPVSASVSALASAPVPVPVPASVPLAPLQDAVVRQDWSALQRGLIALGSEGAEVYRQPEVQALLASAAVELSRRAPTLLQQLCLHLAARPSGDGADALYALGQIPGPGPLLFQVREGLTRSLKAGTVSPALRFTLELSWSPCPRKVKLIERAAAEGDLRTRRELEALRSTECVRRGGCCLKQLPGLAEAIERLKEH
jgi:serine/threonine protein kinase